MTTLESAKRKWARKMAQAGPKWKKGVTGKETAWCEGVARFLGTGTCNPDALNAYRAGVDAVSAEEFGRAVAGKEEKWAKKLREALGG